MRFETALWIRVCDAVLLWAGWGANGGFCARHVRSEFGRELYVRAEYGAAEWREYFAGQWIQRRDIRGSVWEANATYRHAYPKPYERMANY